MIAVISYLTEPLQYAFIQRALLAGSFIALSCAFLGVFLVLRRFSLIGEGLAHVCFGTIGLALLLNTTPMVVSVPLVMLAALLILALSEKTTVYGDAAIGLLSSLGIAVGVLLASLGGGFNVDLFSYLFGNILSVSSTEVIFSIILSLSIIMIVILFYHDLFAITFDEEFAHVLGIKTRRMNQLLILCTALTVVLGIKVVGTLLVSSLIIFPAVTALQIARGFKTAILLSVIFAVVSVISGIFLSFLFDLPAGATIVIVNAIFFSIAFTIRQIRG
jgi:zinc transport system permease protein